LLDAEIRTYRRPSDVHSTVSTPQYCEENEEEEDEEEMEEEEMEEEETDE
jgi:hypothetical protein